MKQRQLFDKNPNLFSFGKSSIDKRATGQLKHLPLEYLGQHGPSHRLCNDLYENIKPLVVLGRIIMVIPCSKSNYSTYKQLKLSVSLLPVFCITLLSMWSLVQMIFGIKLIMGAGTNGKLGVMEYLNRSIAFMHALMEFFIYTYFLRRSDKLYRIFDKWSEMASKIDLEEDRLLKYWAYILVSALLPPLISNACLLADLFYAGTNVSTTDSAIYKVFVTLLTAWNDVVPYSPYFVIIIIVLKLWSASSRVFVPLLIIFFSRAVSFQFEKIIETATNSSDVSEAHYADMGNKVKAFWQDLVSTHRGLVFLLRTINNFTSPLVFSWIVTNIHFLSMLLFRILVGSESLKVNTHVFAITFGVELIMFVATIISAARVNKNAEKILIVLRNCPKEDFYDTEVCRLEHQISTNPRIGLSGMGCFIITKPFLIKVFNAVFTMEIIMLQAVPNNGGGSPQGAIAKL